MGIINVTPDSFYSGNSAIAPAQYIALAKKMIDEGADIIDIGGQSKRPGSTRLSAGEETDRLLPVITGIRKTFPEILLSADTYHSKVALAAVQAGADIINDISSGEMDHTMIETVASLKVPYICMHMKGRPEIMHVNPSYDNVVKEVLDFFIAKTGECKKAGIADIIIDPGFGFGKNISHNLTLLHGLNVFKMLDRPLLAGLSRKSTIYKTLGTTPFEALNGTTVLNTIALQNGADILRVHDVKEAREVITLVNAYNKNAVPDDCNR